MKLPVEIRDRILNLIIRAAFRTDLLIPATNDSTCTCPSIDRASPYQTAQMKALPTLLGTSLNHEFCRIFFRTKTFRFRCACELLVHLSRGSIFQDNVRHVNVHWCGRDSAEAFKMLASCPKLESLTVTISRSTYTHLNKQGELMRSFFPVSFRNTRLLDVLGLDELLTIRGLKAVRACHAQLRSNTSFAVEMERAGLSSLLSSKLTLPLDVSLWIYAHCCLRLTLRLAGERGLGVKHPPTRISIRGLTGNPSLVDVGFEPAAESGAISYCTWTIRFWPRDAA